ncbi:MAG: GAF domain-containing protein [Microthrixaceae bacterium]|nr:GAF domain-containing protein [Microthrixaceae bacterium]
MTTSQPRRRTDEPEERSVNDTLAALRAMRVGSFDDSTRDLDLPAWARAGVAPAITVGRWGAVGFGIAFSAPKAFNGSYLSVVAVAISLFLTTWRTVLPVRLASSDPRHRVSALVDVALFGIATGITGGLESPFTFALFVSIGVIAFGWGYMPGMWALATAIASLLLTVGLSENTFAEQADSQRDVALTFMSLAVVLMCAFVRDRLVDAEKGRGSLAGEIDSLSAANELLALVNTVARSLPSSLTLREALEACRRQISDSFGARVIALVAYDESAEEWVPRLADGCVLNPAYRTSQLPPMFKETLSIPRPMLIDHDEDSDAQNAPVQPGMRSGIYARLETRSKVVGLLAVEHPDPNRFNEHHLTLMSDMAEVLALTIDNARWFGRLRTLGAEEERVRLARDLHDRLGQWLTYIGFELERIIMLDSAEGRAALTGEPTPQPPEGDMPLNLSMPDSQSVVELQRLYGDVQSALDELRETLRQLRSGVTEDDSFTLMGQRLLDGFEQRSGIATTFEVNDGGDRLPVPVENELFRILQESLNNISKHAGANSVTVIWTIEGGNYELSIADDGRGFAVGRGVRESAYGLVGMRERADVIGADLEIESKPGEGTRIRVGAGRISRGN